MLRHLVHWSLSFPAISRAARAAMPDRVKHRLKERYRQQAYAELEQKAPPRERLRIEAASASRPSHVDASLPEGVNLIGFAKTISGLGEHFRGTARALEAAGVPFGVIDISHLTDLDNGDTSITRHVMDSPRYNTNLFLMPGDHLLLCQRQFPDEWLNGRYAIHHCSWELFNFPESWRQGMNYVDELWAISSFMTEGTARHATIPVLNMSVPIEFKAPTDFSRKPFGLPANDFLFFFAFDMSSLTSRKNPEAVLEAFLHAFPADTEKDENVGVVIKISRIPGRRDQEKRLNQLRKRAKADPRIHLIDDVLPREQLLQLMQCCNAFVSLHRAEGFGMGIAEAMRLGKPVIVTNYSGNTEFTKADNSCLVDYTLKPLSEGDYLFHEGQVWAEPEIASAASHMRRLATDHAYSESIGKNARHYIESHYSYRVMGQRYRERLEFLQLLSAKEQS